jgi:hypothetical protein
MHAVPAMSQKEVQFSITDCIRIKTMEIWYRVDYGCLILSFFGGGYGPKAIWKAKNS